MTAPTDLQIPTLPPAAAQGLHMALEALKTDLGASLRTAMLFGSAAEGRLRTFSDVNLLLVIDGLDLEKLAPLRDTLRSAQALARLRFMFLDTSEVEDAARAFPEKFDDLRRRHRLLHGVDPFATISVDRVALAARLDQVLLNQALRLRESCLLQGLRAEQATRLLSEAAGPLRACAASLWGLRGEDLAPKEALARFVTGEAPVFEPLLAEISQAREAGKLPPGHADVALTSCIALIGALRRAVKGAR